MFLHMFVLCILFLTCVFNFRLKFHVSLVLIYCIVVNHLSVTNDACSEYRHVNHFSVKILELSDFIKNLDADHLIVRDTISKTSFTKQDIIGSSVTGQYQSFMFTMTAKTVFKKDTYLPSLGLSYIITISLIFCVITTLLKMFTNFGLKTVNYKR